MNLLRNVFALIGILAVLGGGLLYNQYKPMISVLSDWDLEGMMALGKDLDPKAIEVYRALVDQLIITKNPAEATVWKYPVEEGLSVGDVEISLRNIANEHNIKAVGELPLSEQVKLMTGEEQRFLKIYMFCNPLTAMKMVEYNDAFSAYLPCRISLIEDKQGKLWLYALNMDMMVWGGETLPDYLLEEAIKVRFIMMDIMERAAEGDF